VWTSLTIALVDSGEEASVGEDGGEEKCEPNPKPIPKPEPSSADVAERGVASIGVRSTGNLSEDGSEPHA